MRLNFLRKKGATRGMLYALLILFLLSAPSSKVLDIRLRNPLDLAPVSAEASPQLMVEVDYKCPVGDTPAFSNGTGPQRYCERDILVNGSSFSLRFKLAGGVYNATLVPERKMLEINFINGNSLPSGIQLALPRQLIDARSGNMDTDFTVMLDGQSADYIESRGNTTTRELFILNSHGNHTGQIIGTTAVPEFLSLNVLICSLVTVLALFAMYRKFGKLDLIHKP